MLRGKNGMQSEYYKVNHENTNYSFRHYNKILHNDSECELPANMLLASVPHQAKHSNGLLAFTRRASPTIRLSVFINDVKIGSSIA